jgi:AmiR/NasT family two-component response regulator
MAGNLGTLSHPIGCSFEQACEETMPVPRVLIVEGEAITRIGYETIVGESGFELAGSSGSAIEALQVAEARPPSVAVVNIDPGPCGDALWAARMLAERFNARLVLITATDAPDVLGAAALMGPAALLQKPVMPIEVIQAITDAAPARSI